MSQSRPPTDDAKDMVIGGCHVRLTYGRTAEARWTVTASVRCGIGEHADEQCVITQPYDSRDRAEREALQQITARLGENTDRSRSRVQNWT